MTRIMVRVTSAREAVKAAQANIDAIEVVVGSSADIAAVRRAFPRTLRLRFESSHVTPDMLAVAGTVGADELAIRLDALAPVASASRRGDIRIIGLIVAGPNQLTDLHQVRDQVDAFMLEAGGAERLLDQAGIARLDAFALACQNADMPFGLEGGLEPPDVARLLMLRPDVLGFDSAVRVGHRPGGALDPTALDAIRALVPRDDTAAPHADARAVTDRIFVRDFISLLSIGAYQAEHSIRQRVRFSVDADVRRVPVVPRDMRDVFSYDVIIETIRVLSQRAHVSFVETLAEEIAASLLTHADLIMVMVKVEKLDVIEGSVGIEIIRRPA